MTGFLDKITGDKKEWNMMEARAKALPEAYRIVYDEIKQYIWKSSGVGAIDVLKGILDLFEEGAASGNTVLQMTGDNVAAFCDELMKDAETYIENWRNELNLKIATKLKKYEPKN